MLGVRGKAATFCELADMVLRQKQVKSERTRKNAAWQIARLKRNFGHLPPNEIDEDTWADYIAREEQRRPRKYFDDRKYMRMVLRLARNKRLITDRIELAIPDIPGEAGREISAAELAELERHATPNLRFQIQIAWRMGLRRGELLGLRWDEVDLEGDMIRLPAWRTKTRKSRAIPIPPVLMPEFRRRKARAACQWVFWNPSLTGPVTTNNKAWRRAKSLAGVTARWQDLRVTCATVMVRKKVPVPHGAKYLGNSPAIFAKKYTFPDLRDLQKIARIMAR